MALTVAVLLIGAVAPAAFAQTRGANVNITPKRITLDRAHRIGTILVYNQGDEAGVFDIGLVDRVMLPDGQIVELATASAKPEQKPYADKVKSAHDLVTVSPRHITLGPGKGQTIRLMIGDLPDNAAEFRSHLTISTLPSRSAGVTADQAAAGNQNQFRIVVNSVYGLSVPVVVRAGPLEVRAAIENVRLEVVEARANPSAPLIPTAIVSFDLVRQGANSLFGDIAIRYGDQKASEAPVGVALSLGVYAELERRHIQLPLTRRPTPGEPVLVTFTDQDTQPGKVLATSAPLLASYGP
jgi:hypothetical protein